MSSCPHVNFAARPRRLERQIFGPKVENVSHHVTIRRLEFALTRASLPCLERRERHAQTPGRTARSACAPSPAAHAAPCLPPSASARSGRGAGQMQGGRGSGGGGQSKGQRGREGRGRLREEVGERKGRRGEGEKGRGKRERRGTGARQIELLAALSRATTRTAPQGRMRATAGERKIGATHGQRACTRLIVPWPGRAAMLVDGNGPC